MDNEKEQMITEKSWEEFRNTGLFLLVNQFLQIFGWSLVVSVSPDNEDVIESVFPARTKYRGFSDESVDRAHKRISTYMVENAEELKKESEL
jgi:hypothetical protein